MIEVKKMGEPRGASKFQKKKKESQYSWRRDPSRE